MRTPIAFVSRYAAAEEADWIAALSTAMPDETVVSFQNMDEAARKRVEVAVVANPDPADIEKLPALKWIHSVWAGVERMVAELRDKAPPIVRMVDPGLTRTMAEAVLAWCYYIQRDMPMYRRQQFERVWQRLPYRAPSTMTVGILGLGELGQAAAKWLLHAGFQVTGWSRTPKAIANVESFTGEAGLDALLGKSDIVVLLLPLTDDTRGLMNAERFNVIKPGAALINFARGPIVDSDALLAALASGKLSHAVLDVFNKEPISRTCLYWHHPDVTVLPHIAAETPQASASQVVAKNIAQWRKSGQLPITINLQHGY